ncbi:MAG: hypothetical protein AB7O59_03920 [Pirellulales bacterium]
MTSIVRSLGNPRGRGPAVGLASLLLLGVAPVLFAGSPPAATEDIPTLVRQLGSPKFIERERAARRLTALGAAAKEALAAVTDDPDAELRSRARAVLATVTEADFQARLEAFEADYDGRRRRSLPGWERFSKLLGGDPRARQLFVEMARAEPQLLEAYATTARAASETLDARCTTLLDQFMDASGRDSTFSLGTVATLLLVGSEQDVTVNEQVGVQLYTWMIYQPTFFKHARSGPWSPIMKKLLGQWIVKDTSSSTTMQNLIFAASYDLEREGLTLATKVLGNEPANAQLRQFALLAVGRFGAKQHLALVEKHLHDASACGAIQVTDPPRQVDVQLRDVALSVAVHLAGLPAAEYGTVSVQSSPQSFFQVPALAFADAAHRDASIRRYQQWRTEHPVP